jgi:hypothetical protein
MQVVGLHVEVLMMGSRFGFSASKTCACFGAVLGLSLSLVTAHAGDSASSSVTTSNTRPAKPTGLHVCCDAANSEIRISSTSSNIRGPELGGTSAEHKRFAPNKDDTEPRFGADLAVLNGDLVSFWRVGDQLSTPARALPPPAPPSATAKSRRQAARPPAPSGLRVVSVGQ